MSVEPLYGFPVERPGDREGWSVVDGEPGDVLAERIAAELDRIEGDITAFTATIAALPRTIQTGTVQLPREIFQYVDPADYFYSDNFNYVRGSQAVVFERSFDDAPSVVLLPNNSDLPGLSIEATVTGVTPLGFTAVLAAANFTGTFVSRWIAVERTQ